MHWHTMCGSDLGSDKRSRVQENTMSQELKENPGAVHRSDTFTVCGRIPLIGEYDGFPQEPQTIIDQTQ